jgi:nitrile hydratase beta subunit
MDGIHDLGGMEGFGPVVREHDEPVFHHAWEATAFAVNAAAIGVLGAYNSDEYRHAVERLDPAHYLTASYYERMLTGAATLLVEKGLVSQDDLQSRAGGPFPLASPARTNGAAGGSREATTNAARFEIGDRVEVIARSTPGHTRCPRYVLVTLRYPLAELPELRAHSSERRQEHTYAVQFGCDALWEDGDPTQSVVVELFESYLGPSR